MAADLNEVVRNYNAEAKGQTKGDILTDFMTSFTPLMLALDKLDKDNGQDQQAKLAKIKMEELQRKERMQQEQIKSMEKQLQAMREAEKIKVGAGNKIDPKAKDRKEANAGCCSGDKCQIM